MKYLLRFLVTTVIFLSYVSVTHAQSLGEASGQHMMNLLMSNKADYAKNLNSMGIMPMMNAPYIHRPFTLFNTKESTTITFKDSTTRETDSKIYADTTLRKHYLLFINRDLKKSDPNREIKIYADQTSKIVIKWFDGVIITGIATDSCWLFKVTEGRINVYTYLRGNKYDYDNHTIAGIQQANGPILPYTIENLKKMITRDKEAVEQFNKKHYFKALKTFNKNIAKKASN